MVVLIVSWYSLKVTVDFYRTKFADALRAGAPQVDLHSPHCSWDPLLLGAQFLRRTFILIGKWRTLGKEG